MEDVDGYWRRAVDAAVRATFEDEEPILGEWCVWCVGEAIDTIKRRETCRDDFMSFRCARVDEAANCVVCGHRRLKRQMLCNLYT
jgi:hypothetical protein